MSKDPSELETVTLARLRPSLSSAGRLIIRFENVSVPCFMSCYQMSFMHSTTLAQSELDGFRVCRYAFCAIYLVDHVDALRSKHGYPGEYDACGKSEASRSSKPIA